MARDRWPIERDSSSARPRSPAWASRPEPGIDLQELLSVLWLRKWLILPITLITLGLALFVSSRQTPIYESHAGVLVTPIETGTGSEPRSPNLATEAEIVSSVVVAEIVANNLNIEGDPSRLLGDLSVDQPSDTEILEISYRDPDPARAQRLATGFAQGYLEYRQQGASQQITEQALDMDAQVKALKQRLTEIERRLLSLRKNDPRRGSLEVEAASLRNLILQTQIARLGLPGEVSGGRIIRPASRPGSPISPDHVVNGLFGLAAGLVLGVGLALTRDRMSGRLRSSEELEEYLEAPVLAAIPRVPQWRSRRKAYLITSARWRSPAAEAYRVLRTNMLAAATEVGAKSIVVTSTNSGEGKSATVANLGVVLARAGKRVSLVSADLRRPRLNEFFRLDGRIGLSDVLARRMPLREAVRQVALPTLAPWDQLLVLSSGRIPEDPAEVLTSATLSEVLRELEEDSDIVLIDVPPILPVADAAIVAGVVKNVILVIGPDSGTRVLVGSARQQLERVGARILGGVLNGPETIKARTYTYY